eukprot:3407755-Rhodomonas_salina.1
MLCLASSWIHVGSLKRFHVHFAAEKMNVQQTLEPHAKLALILTPTLRAAPPTSHNPSSVRFFTLRPLLALP